MTRKPWLKMAAWLGLMLGVFAISAAAQSQIVLGDSYQAFHFTSTGGGTIQLACGCSLSGSAFGTGALASTGSYTLSGSSDTLLTLTATSGGSFLVSASQPLNFTYVSAQGSLTGQITFYALEQAAESTTAVLEGELTVTGGSFASLFSPAGGEVSLLLPIGGNLYNLVSASGSITAQIGYPSTLTISTESTESCPVCRDFVTGGGWILAPDGAKANFGVHGGIRNGGFWGHLEYNDQGSAPPMMVQSASITNYIVLSATEREIQGTAIVNGMAGYTFTVWVTDNGSGVDSFSIQLSNGYQASGQMGGGNITIHSAHGHCLSTLEADATASAQMHH